MVPLSARRPGIFAVFFQKEAQALVEELQAGEEQAQPIAVVSPFHLLEGAQAPVEQNLQVRGPPQLDAALRTVQVVGRDDMGTAGAEAHFHGFSVGQLRAVSNPIFWFLPDKPWPGRASTIAAARGQLAGKVPSGNN